MNWNVLPYSLQLDTHKITLEYVDKGKVKLNLNFKMLTINHKIKTYKLSYLLTFYSANRGSFFGGEMFRLYIEQSGQPHGNT